MIRITKNSGKINCIKILTKQEMEVHVFILTLNDPGYNGVDIDSFLIVPGVTQYKHIYSSNEYLIFDSNDNYIYVEFASVADLERYFSQLMREIKLNQILDINIDKNQ
jgi:hypothetical protein